MRITIAVVFAAVLTVSASAQEFMADAGAPAVAFPNADRTVADIVSPIWHSEKERDVSRRSTSSRAAAWHQIRDDRRGHRRGERLLCRTAVPDRWPPWPRYRRRCCARIFTGLRRRVRDLGLQNVAIGLGEPHDPRLPADSLDIAILVHMYHEIAQPYALLYNLIPALKPGARVGIVDTFRRTSEHGTPPNLLRCELAAVGYREISLDRLTGSDAYLAIFAPPSVASRTRPEAMIACKAP